MPIRPSLHRFLQSFRKDKSEKPYLLFDAGGTLVFPDQLLLKRQAQANGITFTDEQLFDGYCRVIHDLDCRARQSGIPPAEPPWPQGYTYDLMQTLGLPDATSQAIAQAVEACRQKQSLWTFTFPWVRNTLACLHAQGYRMSVVSNSNGGTRTTLKWAGLAGYFEEIFTSYKLGVAKPNPAIFEIVLDRLGLTPADVLHVGDVFYLDVLGANQAGIGGIHLDPHRLYAGWPGAHLPDIRHLPDWLALNAADPPKSALFPFHYFSSSLPVREQPRPRATPANRRRPVLAAPMLPSRSAEGFGSHGSLDRGADLQADPNEGLR